MRKSVWAATVALSKRLLPLAVVTLFAAPPADAQRATREFTVASANVDGLPEFVHIEAVAGAVKKDIYMNPDGSKEDGAKRMGELFAQRQWDIIGLSEDFNYHYDLIEPCKKDYRSTTYRGPIHQDNIKGNIELGYLGRSETSSSVYMDTDGLCLLTSKVHNAYDEAWFGWNQKYGWDNNQNDNLIDKGYRFYTVKLAGGEFYVDVYILHMDAGSFGDKDTTNDDNVEPQGYGNERARTAQLKQLAQAILSSKNGNPILILGDTNCRYTRDTLKADLIDAITKDPRFEIHDPWVDFQWDGVYPEYGTGSIMVGQYGQQKGEVVDKIFYINNKDSECVLTCKEYFHDDGFTYGSGEQISDHYPVVLTMEIEGPASPEPEPVVYPDAPVKGPIVNGTTYYLRNLATGKFLRAGGKYNTQAVLSDYATAFTVTGSNGQFKLESPYDGCLGENEGNYWVDRPDNVWTLTQVKDNIYTMSHNGNAIGHNGDVMGVVTANASDENQQWEFLTQADLVNELYYAKPTAPKDATFLMSNPDFVRDKGWTHSGNKATTLNMAYRVDGYTIDATVCRFVTNSTGNNHWDFDQTVSGLPAGKYRVYYQALAYNLYKPGTLSVNINGDSDKFTWESRPEGIIKYSWGKLQTPEEEDVLKHFAAGEYSHYFDITISDDGDYANKLVFDLEKIHNGSTVALYLDNFRIECLGLDGYDFDNVPYERVKEALEDTQNKADKIGVMIDNRGVQKKYNNLEINGDGWAEVEQCYRSLAEAMLKLKQIPCDYTYAIVNNSFELYPDYTNPLYANLQGGYPFGWKYRTNHALDSGVWLASDKDKKTENPDGLRIFNTFAGEWEGFALEQNVSLSPGIYRLEAKVTSGKDNTVYIYAGEDEKNRQGKTIVGDKSRFEEVELVFQVFNSQPIAIGVVGGLEDGSFTFDGGKWYKADDFRLTRIGDEEMITANDMVQHAIDEVSSYKRGIDLSKYQDMVDNYKIMGDGTNEFNEIYGLLRDKLFANLTPNTDLTMAIANSDFEWGNYYGWTTEVVHVNETGVKSTVGQYEATGSHANYLFNTWAESPKGGKQITQTIYGLPKGKYSLKAMVSSVNEGCAYISANGKYTTVATTGDKAMHEGELIFDFPGGDVEIGVFPRAYWAYNPELYGDWFKADYFRLTYLGEPDLTEYYDYLQKVINTVNANMAKLPEAYSSQWEGLDKYQALITNKTLVGDGKKEASEIYEMMQKLVLSQTEDNADMKYAIVNNSFEFGDMEGWTCNTGRDTKVTSEYPTGGTDGTYLFNTWHNETAMPVSQTIPSLRAGKYILSALVASNKDAQMTLCANSSKRTITVDNQNDHFNEVSVEFTIAKNGTDLTIAVVPTIDGELKYDGTGPWFKADNFRLTLLEAPTTTVVWTMDGNPDHKSHFDTMILPFAATLPAGYTAYTTSLSTVEDKYDKNGLPYHIVKTEKVEGNKIEANKPYIIKWSSAAAQAAMSAPRKVSAQVAEGVAKTDDEGKNTITFTGVATNDKTTYTDGLLTGTLAEATVPGDGNWIMKYNETNGSFFYDHTGNATVSANKAYVNNEATPEKTFESPYILLDEAPETLEGETTGIADAILPDTPVEVYTISGILLRSGVEASTALDGLDGGIYILRNRSAVQKVAK